MNCPSEENMIRIKLDGIKVIKKLEFDIENRKLTVFHTEENNEILTRLESLNFGAKLSHSSSNDEMDMDKLVLFPGRVIIFSCLLICIFR